MAYITVDVDVDVDEFETHELIEELEDRLKKGKVNKDDLEGLQLAVQVPNNQFNTPSLRERMKLDHLAEVFEQYSIEEIQELLPNKIMMKVI